MVLNNSQVERVTSKVSKFWLELDDHHRSFSSEVFLYRNKEQATLCYNLMKFLKDDIERFGKKYPNEVKLVKMWNNLLPRISHCIQVYEKVLMDYENAEDNEEEYFKLF